MFQKSRTQSIWHPKPGRIIPRFTFSEVRFWNKTISSTLLWSSTKKRSPSILKVEWRSLAWDAFTYPSASWKSLSAISSELSERVPIRDPVHFEMTQEDVSSLELLAQARAAGEAGDYEKSEAIYRQLVEIRPDDPVMHSGLAYTLARQNKHPEAKEHYLAALAINPEQASALYGLANLLSLEKNYDEAVRRYKESLAIRPDHVPSLLNLGSLLAFQGKIEEAATQFRQGLEAEPNHFGCHRQLAQLLLQQQKLPEAIVHLRAALESRPELGVLHAQLAMALAAEADFEEAWTHVKEAERLGANLPPRFLEELRRLSPEPGK